MKTLIIKSISAAITVASVAACNGGGDDDVLPVDVPHAAISGVAYLGPITYGTVTVYSLNSDGTRGASLGSGVTDYLGHFTLDTNVPDQQVLTEVKGGYYNEAATGAYISLQADHRLLAVSNYVAGHPISINPSYWTTLATGLAEYKIKMGAPVAQAITSANAEISSLLGFDIVTTSPSDITSAINKSGTLTPELEYGFYDAAISRWTAYVSDLNQQPTHSLYSSIAFTQVAYLDIKYDGVLDGVGASGTLTFFGALLSPTVYRHDLAVHVLKMAHDSRNVTGLGADKLVVTAQRLNNATNAIFGIEPVVAIDDDGPIFTRVVPADQSALYGTFTASAEIIDMLGVSSVDFLIDDKPIGSATDANAPQLAIDSRDFTEGVHTLTIRATNIAGIVASVDTRFGIYNTSTAITNVVPAANTWVGQSMTASATVTDPIGVQSVAFYIGSNFKGVAADPLSPSLVMDISGFIDAPLNLRIIATNLAGNTQTSETMLNFDNTVPMISATAPANSSYLKASFTASATAFDANLTATSFFIDGNPLGNVPDKFNASMLIDTTKYSEGAHTVAVVATDKANNKTTKLIPLFFDNTAPAITNMYPANGTVVGNEVFNVGATVTDLAVASVMWYLDGKLHDGSSPLDKPSSFVVGQFLTPGAHTITVEITDKVGLVSRASTTVTR